MSAEWREGRYGGQFLDLELFSISVDYSTTKNSKGENGYVWRSNVAGSAHDVRFKSMDEAKRRAERWAHKALTRALHLCPVVDGRPAPGTPGERGS